MAVTQAIASQPRRAAGARIHVWDEPLRPVCRSGDVPVFLMEEAGGSISVEAQGERVILVPSFSVDRRHTIRPIALFERPDGCPELSQIMGRIVFCTGDREARPYTPFTHDARKRLRALFLPVETMPEDEAIECPGRWRYARTIVGQTLRNAGLDWRELTENHLLASVEFVGYPEPLEGCVLHALAQAFGGHGQVIVEIGSFRGASTGMLAMGLRSAAHPAALMSIDPHEAQPINAEQVRVTLRQIGEEHRLIQFPMRSDSAADLLRPGCAGLVYIDGDHSPEQVRRDFERYRDLVADGGCLAFHDYGFGAHTGRTDRFPGVTEVIDKEVHGCSEFRPLILAHTLFAFTRV